MPRSAAASLTAFSSLLGRRILTRASLGANSKRVGWRAERSYRVRSLSATNRSAWASFSRRGSLFRGLGLLFIMAHLLFVHEPGADRPDESKLVDAPVRKRYQQVPARRGSPDADVSSLRCRVRWRGKDTNRVLERRFDLADRHAVALALCEVALVPIEPGDRITHLAYLMYVQMSTHHSGQPAVQCRAVREVVSAGHLCHFLAN